MTTRRADGKALKGKPSYQPMRYPAVAGSFYPADEAELRALLEELYKEKKDVEVEGELKAIVAPHAGLIFSGRVAATAYSLAGRHRDEFDRIAILGPSHYFAVEGSFSSADREWLFPFGVVEVSPLEPFPPSREVHEPEHSIEVQFPFLWWEELLNKEIHPVAVAVDDPRRVAKALESFEGLIVVSTDLSHYYPYEVAVKLDSIANRCIPSLDIVCVEERVEACGKLPLLALMHLAKAKGWKGKFLHYMNSGDVYDKSRVVGYGAYAFYK